MKNTVKIKNVPVPGEIPLERMPISWNYSLCFLRFLQYRDSPNPGKRTYSFLLTFHAMLYHHNIKYCQGLRDHHHC